MLDLLVKTKIPLIKLTSRDLVNTDYLIQLICGLNDDQYGIDEGSLTEGSLINAKQVGVKVIRLTKVEECDWASTYLDLKKRGLVCIVVNDEVPSEHFFDAGSLEPDKNAISIELQGHVHDSHLERALNILNGLTLKEVSECISLAYSEGALTPETIAKYRVYFGSQVRGVHPVEVKEEFYLPVFALEKYVVQNIYTFNESQESELMPRGLILHGPAGTGKTQASKYIARSFGVPLYRLDIGSMMNKWHGESESNLRNSLAFVDREAPCVLLLDEIEKVFASSAGEDGSSSRMLGNLLWWLQEHTSRVFVVMTTNDIEALPPELYREGRIDSKVLLPAFQDKGKVHTFCAQYLQDYAKKRPGLNIPTWDDVFSDLGGPSQLPTPGLTPAKCQATILNRVKLINY
jgi:hypothetical protein